MADLVVDSVLAQVVDVICCLIVEVFFAKQMVYRVSAATEGKLAGDRDGNHEGKALDDGAERQLAKYVPPSPGHSESAVAQST